MKMYYYLLWWGPLDSFHFGPSALLHSEKISDENLQSWWKKAVELGVTGRIALLDYLVREHGFTKPELAGYAYVIFPPGTG